VTEAHAKTLVIAGPTASGKSAAAMAVAQRWPVELISVDSAQVYQGMDVGTAKPSAQEQALVRHHLIDLCPPTSSYSAAEFMRDVEPLLRDIRARGRHPVLVGGTMLYFKAWLDGLNDMPSANLAVRAQIEQEARERGWPALHAALAQVDPSTAARLAPRDAQRISRALEVYRSSGRTLSSYQSGPASLNSQWPRVHLVSLEPQDRAWLHARIAQRFDDMLQEGLIDEVMALRARGDLHASLPAIRCVGYRQGWEALDEHGALNEAAQHQWRERGIAATRQLAKRQLTWLRGMPQRHVVTADAPDAQQQVMAHAQKVLGPSP
jgi:tRNA dimethylallyltransferase